MQGSQKIGIALSGGGYRAAGFHIGTLKKLNELEILEKVDVLSTISGGSIIGAAYCLRKGDFSAFENNMISALSSKNVIKYVLTSWLFLRAAIPGLLLLISALVLPFTRLAGYSIIPLLVFIFLIIRYQFKLLPISKIIEKAYDEFFYDTATLSSLCQQPEIAIGSTNLQTQRHFTFSKRKMEDSFYAYYQPPVLFNGDHFPVARAVMASSCVPFAFTPISIAPCFFCDPEQAKNIDPKLVDGGVYDNQGVHKLTQSNSSYACDIVVVSDAGNKLPFEKLYNNTFTLLLRTVDTFMARIKNFQMAQNIFQVPNKREVAYLSLGWDLDNCLPGFYRNLKEGTIAAGVLAAHKLPQEWIDHPVAYQEQILKYMDERCNISAVIAKGLPKERLQKIRGIGTNLICISKDLIDDMIIHSACLTEIQIKLYCPSFFN